MTGLARLENLDVALEDAAVSQKEEAYGRTALDGSHSGIMLVIDGNGQLRQGDTRDADGVRLRLVRQAQGFKAYTMRRAFCAVDTRRLIAGLTTPDELRDAMGTSDENFAGSADPCANGCDASTCYHTREGHDETICFHLRDRKV